MSITDLNREQLTELKQAYLTELLDRDGLEPSWGELADADRLIPDAEIFEAYEGFIFSPGDFMTD